MFRQILVPTDFSQKHTNPLEIAANLAEKFTSTIHLLHVIEIIPDAAFSEFEDFYNKLEKRAQKKMSTLVSNHKGKSVQILPHISYGNRVQEILKFISQYEIDLIIMNSHKVNLKHPIHGWGTISYKVVLLSGSPVMLVK